MKTNLVYLEDPYKKELSAEIVDVVEGINGKTGIVLNQTIFYPFGGGQPTDQGIIIDSNGNIESVVEVVLKEDVVYHLLKDEETSLSQGNRVELKIDWKRRYKNMIVHSAGHVIDFALQRLNLVPEKIIPRKGNHGSKPFIEYVGSFSEQDIAHLKDEVSHIVQSDVKFSWEFTDLETLKQKATYLQPGLPSNKPLRALTLENYGTVADGGTIVRNVNEIDSIEITKVDIADNMVSISYKASAPESKQQETQPKAEESQHLAPTNQHQISEIKKIKQEKLEEINSCETLEGLEETRKGILGKGGALNKLLRSLGNLPKEERAAVGKAANVAKSELQKAIEAKEKELLEKEGNKVLDVTRPGKKPKLGHLHLTTQAIREIQEIFERIGFYRVRYPIVEWDYFAFGALNFPDDHPARDEWETFFIDTEDVHEEYKRRVITPHTSSGQVREMRKRKPPIRMMNIGRTGRRQTSVRHLMNFYQFEGMLIDKNVSVANLKGTINYFVKNFFGKDVEIRIRPYDFPFTEPSFEVDIYLGKDNPLTKEGWLEIGGAGMVHPNVLKAGGIDPKEYSGFAFGFGVERNKLSQKGINIDDIRVMYLNDVRFLRQF